MPLPLPFPFDLMDLTPVGSALTEGAAVFVPLPLPLPLPFDLIDLTPVGSALTEGAAVPLPFVALELASTEMRRAINKRKLCANFIVKSG